MSPPPQPSAILVVVVEKPYLTALLDVIPNEASRLKLSITHPVIHKRQGTLLTLHVPLPQGVACSIDYASCFEPNSER
eukprot:scaffold73385_cov31-Tisochrysis_lutea.AAC.1